MKKNYIQSLLFTSLFLIAVVFSAKSQLVTGDIAFTGYISTTATDEFSFVLLKAVTNGTQVNFTDNAWQNGGPFLATEQTITWTCAGALPLGTEVHIVGLVANISGVPNGTVTGTALSLSTTGDQIIAYTGSAGTPTFIGAIHMNVYTLAADGFDTNPTNWDGSHAVGSNYCYLPTGMVSTPNANPTAIWFSTETDNAKLTTCPGPQANAAALRNAIYNTANWTRNDGAPGFTLPTNCFYGLLPAHLIKFNALNRFNNVEITWQSDNEINFSHYEVERSFSGTSFTTVGNVTANNYAGTSNYSYTDNDALKNPAPTIYYRLKMVDKDATYKYSAVATVKNKKDALFIVDNIVNPVKDKISFSVATKTAGKLDVQLTDMNGKIILSRSYNAGNGSTSVSLNDAAGLASGLYLLKITFNNSVEVARLLKQ